MGTVLCLGAGDLGGRIAAGLVARGHEVHAVRRRATEVAAPVIGHRADLTDRRSLDAIAWPRATALVVCVTADRADEAAYRRVYVDGLRNVLASLEERGARPGRVVFVSSTAVYGQRQGEQVTEASPTGPRRFNGVVVLEAEALALDLAALGVTPVCARLGGIYGPGRTRLIERVRRGEEPVGPGVRDPHTNRIHVDDAAAAAAFLVDHPDPPRVVNVVDDEPARRSDVVRWLAARLGVAVPEDPALPTDGPAAMPERDDDKRVVNARLRSLGFALRYPTYREGYGALLAE